MSRATSFLDADAPDETREPSRWPILAIVILAAAVLGFATTAHCEPAPLPGARLLLTAPPSEATFEAVACRDPLPDDEACWAVLGSPAWAEGVATLAEEHAEALAEIGRLQDELCAARETRDAAIAWGESLESANAGLRGDVEALGTMVVETRAAASKRQEKPRMGPWRRAEKWLGRALMAGEAVRAAR